MSKFRNKDNNGTPSISTAALPDIVFMLLFFFMVTTVMRETTLFVEVMIPKATEIKKMEKKSLVSYIYVGPPVKRMQASFGSKPRIQLNDSFATLNEIQEFIASEREAKDEKEIPYMTTSIKSDESVKMGIITDIKQELRKANSLKINYSTRKGTY